MTLCDNYHWSRTHVIGIIGAKNNDIRIVGIVTKIPIKYAKVFVHNVTKTKNSIILKDLNYIW